MNHTFFWKWKREKLLDQMKTHIWQEVEEREHKPLAENVDEELSCNKGEREFGVGREDEDDGGSRRMKKAVLGR